MALISNKTLVYKQVPEGMIKPNVDMVFEDRPIDLTAVPPKGMLVKTLVIGFDPHMRDRMKGPTFVSYVPGYVPDEPMNTFAVAQVLESDHERYQKGDLIAGVLPIAEYGVIPEMVSFLIAGGLISFECPAETGARVLRKTVLTRIKTKLIEAKPMASYMVWKIENKYNLDLGNWVGPLGLAGMTAYVR